jgi:outer membrane receptor for ferrienterochelin and colicins
MMALARTRFRSRLLRAVAFALATLAMGVSSARADQEMDLTTLLSEKVVTTASKTAETSTSAPGTASLMTAEDIHRYGIHTVDEAIAFLSLGGFSSDNLYNPEIGARGILIPGDQGAHMLVLLDGHAVNEPLHGAANLGRGLGIPIELVDHIELILGPGSVLYGSNAMLGVINIVTKRGRSYSGVHAVVETEVGKSYRAGAAFGTSTKLLNAPFQMVSGFEFYKQDGPTFNFGPQGPIQDLFDMQPMRFSRTGEATGYWGGAANKTHYSIVPAGYMRLEWGKFTFNVHASTFKRAAPYSSQHINVISDFNDPENYQIDRVLRGDLTYRTQLTSHAGFTARVYGDSSDRRTYVDYSRRLACRFPVATCREADEGLSRWIGSELQGTLDWWNNSRAVTLIGVDGRYRYAQGRSDLLDHETGRPLRSSTAVIDSSYSMLAAYLQQTAQPTSWLALNGGARLDYDPRFDPVVSPRLATTVNVWEGGALKATYAEAFRAPTFFESDAFIPNALLMRPPALAPERVRSVEGSFEQKFGGNRIVFGVFRSWWKDLVEKYIFSQGEKDQLVASGQLAISYVLGPVAEYRNISSIDNFGFNAGWDGVTGAGRLHYGTNVTGAIARRVVPGGATGQPLVVAPQFFGNARIAYDFEHGLPTLGLAAHFSGNRIADRAFDGNFTPFPVAPPQVELRATLSGPVPLIKGLSYRIGANYAVANRNPYVAGVAQQSFSWHPDAELIPVDRFRATAGISYALFE